MKTITYELNIPRLAFTKALGALWPGAYFLPTSALRMNDGPEPPLPHERFVRVRPTLAGICGTDLHLAFIQGDPRIAPAALPGNSKTYLGHEVVGRVVEAGAGARTLAVGDRVVLQRGDTCQPLEREPLCAQCARGNYSLCEVGEKRGRAESVGGGWSEQIVAHELRFFKVDDDIRDEQACLIEPGAVGVRAVLRRPPKPGEAVLVVGAGTIGLMTLQAVKAVQPDCRLVVMAKYPHQAQMAKRKGADEVLMAREGYRGVARLTGAAYHRSALGVEFLTGGFDLIYDTVGTARTLRDALRWTRAGGAVVLVGVELKPMTIDLTPVWYQEVDLIGIIGHGREQWEGEAIDTFALVVKWLREGKLNFDGYLSARFPLADYRKALAYAADKRNGVIKVVLEPNR
ncbi:MAG: alcohol dehydrogenase catalytic domain-containing protein [Chloroflexi bacterium]|nr:alcohol dehydrogenase catalytic domain-containing protein [Chloroflexota bacterium]